MTGRGSGLRQRDLSRTARFRQFAKLLYPHHPLFRDGPTELEIIGARSDMLTAQLPDGSRRGIPIWMFDEEICAAVRHSPHPMVEVSSLLEIVKVLAMRESDLRNADDECTSKTKQVSDSEVAIRSNNTSVRKRRKQQPNPGRKEPRMRPADSGVDRSGGRSSSEPDRRTS